MEITHIFREFPEDGPVISDEDFELQLLWGQTDEDREAIAAFFEEERRVHFRACEGQVFDGESTMHDRPNVRRAA